jgi:hypothetical protein
MSAMGVMISSMILAASSWLSGYKCPEMSKLVLGERITSDSAYDYDITVAQGRYKVTASAAGFCSKIAGGLSLCRKYEQCAPGIRAMHNAVLVYASQTIERGIIL